MQVAAGELLHSLVVYMVGKSAQMVDHPSSLPPMYNLHKKLFPVLLRLACDVDQVGGVSLHRDQVEIYGRLVWLAAGSLCELLAI